MANAYCHNRYCESTKKEELNESMNKKILIGGYLLFLVALTAIVLYGASIGVYIDPTTLS
ncbi:hypothetical protein [Pelosinus propionicus]|uniref:Uncharacterized protein n=1 Tax=Pelosinus propionicus DSM 13327 TaxID=1123291 RepID=A0A1I4HIH4_9FIRM|nr:hypothetical protein [Pelosinus propionicus]SFL42012.1 hypothetical protein SAMN04490355_100419 [Pelosinus propionicus DSM 13327]